MSWFKRFNKKLLIPAAILAISLVFIANTVFAVPINLHYFFELDTRPGVEGDQEKKNQPVPALVGDGDTINDPEKPGEDWEDVVNGTATAFIYQVVEDTFANNNINNGAEAFVYERTPEETFFTGGGTKDVNGIQDGPWLYKVSNDVVPDKNDIVNAFAAAYFDDISDNTYLYFGLDTFSVNGDANAGARYPKDQHENPSEWTASHERCQNQPLGNCNGKAHGQEKPHQVPTEMAGWVLCKPGFGIPLYCL